MAREIWVLYLNDMRTPKFEVLELVGWHDSEAALKAFVEREEVATYQDGQWGKTFRLGGPLEWFNEPTVDESRHFVKLDIKHVAELPVIIDAASPVGLLG